MRPSARLSNLLVGLALLASAACRATAALLQPGEREHTMEVAPQALPCIAIYSQPCLQVRVDRATDWSSFHDEIEGFTFEPGYRYDLRVATREVPNPPADGGALTWRLLEVVRKARE